jgi:hypothetical protein
MTTCYHPADVWEQQCANEREDYLNDLLSEGRFRDAREDSIYKFYDASKILSNKAVEAFAKIWAKSFMEADSEEHESVKLANELELDWQDAYLILWMRDDYFSTLSAFEKDRWTTVDCDIDDND